jgi:hypothetical protein
MASIVTNFVFWVIVPGILIALFIWSLSLVLNSDGSEKTSAHAGFWVGLLVFAIYLLSQSHTLSDPDFDISRFPNISWGPLIIGAVIGFLFLWIVNFLSDTGFIGVITMLLSGFSSSALFTYIFNSSIRSSALYFTLGIGLGVLLHLVFMPKSLDR